MVSPRFANGQFVLNVGDVFTYGLSHTVTHKSPLRYASHSVAISNEDTDELG